MKAIRVHEFGGPEKLILEDVADLNPGAGEVLIDIHAAGVNPVDTYIRSGAYARKPQLPYTPGHDGAGVVIKAGEGVRKFKAGDRVYVAGSVTGTYAGQALCRESQVYPLPKNITYAQGASLGVPYGTAYRALFQKANALPGETVLVHGASGGVGIAAVQLARAARLTVIGTAGTDSGLQLVQEQGAHHALHHEAVTAEKIQGITGQGVDIIVEMLANKNLAKDLSMLNMRGRIVVVGNRGTIEINPRDAMGRDAAIIGMLLFNATEQELAMIHAALRAGLENGVIRPVIREEMPLADAPRAHETVMSSGSHGKIVLISR